MRFLKGFLHLSTQIFTCGAIDLFQIINGTICTMIHSLTQSTSWDLFTMHWIQYIGLDTNGQPHPAHRDAAWCYPGDSLERCVSVLIILNGATKIVEANPQQPHHDTINWIWLCQINTDSNALDTAAFRLLLVVVQICRTWYSLKLQSVPQLDATLLAAYQPLRVNLSNYLTWWHSFAGKFMYKQSYIM